MNSKTVFWGFKMNSNQNKQTIELTPSQKRWLTRREIFPVDIVRAFFAWMEDEQTKGLKDEPLEASIERIRLMSR